MALWWAGYTSLPLPICSWDSRHSLLKEENLTLLCLVHRSVPVEQPIKPLWRSWRVVGDTIMTFLDHIYSQHRFFVFLKYVIIVLLQLHSWLLKGGATIWVSRIGGVWTPPLLPTISTYDCNSGTTSVYLCFIVNNWLFNISMSVGIFFNTPTGLLSPILVIWSLLHFFPGHKAPAFF